MRLIELTKGQVSKIDDNDFENINKYKWHAHYDPSTKSYYARRSEYGTDVIGKSRTVLMHRAIMNASKGEMVDHIDHDTLNNQRSNLRICTNSQNRANSRKSGLAKNKYKGVSLVKENVNKTNPYMALIKARKRVLYLGYFKTEIEAAIAYNKAALEHHGQFAELNKI